ncbi:hypothetical protein [Humibacter ginsenosidimutans]|uniref:Uncharacterized protein n=1 Tax=Humibacter ginsenosidimutans TaxID=2599293 RepID=A0A5B8M4C3_9MICO|nr:hypothetical protein [Humibacter ginsenosidimutans]QDZ15156.1 hypothetical protein FPZ11_10580 [Humibacter ginsenosidimutans]
MPRKSDASADPTLVRNQSALRTSSGRVWLVVGGILAAVCIIVLLVQWGNSVPLAAIGAVVVALFYAAMIVVRYLLPSPPRLVVLACLFAAMPVWTIIWLFVIVARVT